jgi:small subunit ribosomal protein S20
MPKARTDTKRAEKHEKRRMRNRSVRSAVKTYIGHARVEIAEDPESDETESALRRAIRELDRAAQKGVIHQNNAARRKSRLIKRARVAAEAAA